VKTFSYTPRDGWSPRLPVELDSPQTLVLAFCAPVYFDQRGPVDELLAAFPQSHVLGCSSAGEIFGAELRDESLSCAAVRFAETRLRRAYAGVDESDSSMTFAGDVPEGAMAQLMKANFDRLVQGAAHAALATRANTPEDVDVLAVAISCVGRRLVLNERTEEELEVTVETLPCRSHLVGFYSYGEISPYGDGRCELHNQTMTLTTFAEP